MKINKTEAKSIILEKLKEHKNDTPFLIVIDGKSASGKTTFSTQFNIPVIHTDDFYRPRDREGKLALRKYSGNFDLERFKKEVSSHITDKNGFSYGVFDCASGVIKSHKSIPSSNAYIIDGAYAMHPELGIKPDLSFFFTISDNEQKKRIIARNGNSAYEKFKQIWIPAEEEYFVHFNIENLTDYIVTTEC